MPRKAKAPLSQPIFGEPVFQEEVPTPDPAQFKVTNDDEKFYTKEVQALRLIGDRIHHNESLNSSGKRSWR
jgi:hypothetical protein